MMSVHFVTLYLIHNDCFHLCTPPPPSFVFHTLSMFLMKKLNLVLVLYWIDCDLSEGSGAVTWFHHRGHQSAGFTNTFIYFNRIQTTRFFFKLHCKHNKEYTFTVNQEYQTSELRVFCLFGRRSFSASGPFGLVQSD